MGVEDLDNRAHFLVVEDSIPMGAAYRRLLAPHGRVSLAASVAEARKALAAMRPTGLIADIALTDGSGLDVAREARAMTPDLPILIVSGHVDGVRLEIANDIRAAFLLKPFSPMQIVRFAERAILDGAVRTTPRPKTPRDFEREQARASLAKCLRLPWDDPVRIVAVETFRAILASTDRRRE